MRPFDRLSEESRITLREFAHDTGGFRCNKADAASLARACTEVFMLREESPVFSAVCPCCACNVVQLSRSNGHPLAPRVWVCIHCGFALMGLAVPVSPGAYEDSARCYTCLEVFEATAVWGRR